MPKFSLQNRVILSTMLEVFQSFKLKPSVHFSEDPMAQSYISGWDAFFFNNIVIKRPKDSEKLVAEIKRFHEALKKPLLIWTTPETIQDRKSSLTQALSQNFSSHGSFQGMLLDLNDADLSESLSDSVEIREVKDEKSSHDFSIILCDVFQMKPIQKEMAAWVLKQSQSPFPSAYNYLAIVKGVPVGVSSLFINRSFSEVKTGGLYNAGVLPEYRKLGIGSVMAKHRVEVAKSMGVENLSIILMSDAMARGYCERMGFKKFGEFTPYFLG